MKLRDLARRRTDRPTKLVLASRLRFETLLSELSAGLIHVTARDIDAALERALQQVVTFLGVDRGNLDEHADGRPGVRLSWARAGPRGAAAGHGRRPVPLDGGETAARGGRPILSAR